MKYILIFLLALLCSVGYAQNPISQYIGAPTTTVISRGALKADSSLILPQFPDTASANKSPYIKFYPGNLIRVFNDIYMRNTTASGWILISNGGGSNNFIDSLRKVGDSVFARKYGVFVYQYTDSAQNILANNGLSFSGDTLQLGGTLTKNTEINAKKNNFGIDSLYYGYITSKSDSGSFSKISTIAGEFVDIGESAMVRLEANKVSTTGNYSILDVKSDSIILLTNDSIINIPSIKTNADTSGYYPLKWNPIVKRLEAYTGGFASNVLANNGLTKSLDTIQLGGALNQNTTIDGGSSSAYNMTFTNGDFILNKGNGIGGLRGNLIMSNDRGVYWNNTSGPGIGGSSVFNGISYFVPGSGYHYFYGNLNLANYGNGTKTGTPTYNLGVTSLGNVIETPLPTPTDTTSLSNRINLKLNISDTSSMLQPYLRAIDTSNKWISSITSTSDTTLAVVKGTNTTTLRYVKGSGTNTQYIRGDGTYANFPTVGGGGGGQVYYLNGNTYQRQINGDSLFQMSTIVGGGSGRVFQRNGTGLLASFITDSLKPNQTVLPAGVWLFNIFLQEAGGGSNHVQIQVKMRKWNGTTLTTIDSSQIEEISNGNIKDLYTLSISLNQNFALNATDRIVLQFYITNNSSNKTTYLYTEDNNLASVTTTFPSGISSLNGLTASTQNFAVGTSGTDFGISSSGSTHTFNLPTASATNRGALSSTDWSTFNGKLNPSDTISLSNRIDTKLNISDTAAMLSPYMRSNTANASFVTSVFRKTASDSVFFVRGGSNVFAFKDSAGAAVTQQTYTTGASVTCNNATTWLIIDPSSLRTSLTINLPSSPSPNQDVLISFGGTLTTGVVVNSLTISPTPLQSTTPSFIEVGESVGYRWNATNSKWYRVN